MKWLIKMLGKGKKKKAGFTLIELMIVIIIVGILAAIAVPIYSGFVKRARSSEAKATVGGIRTAQLVYHAEHQEYVTTGDSTTRLTILGIDLAKNRWFKVDASDMHIEWVDTDVGSGLGVWMVGKINPILGIGARIYYTSGVLHYTTDGTDGTPGTWISGD